MPIFVGPIRIRGMKETNKEDFRPQPLTVRIHPRARRIVFRVKRDGIHVSAPPGTSPEAIEQAAERLKDKLDAARRKALRPLIDRNFRIKADFFELSLSEGNTGRFLPVGREGRTEIFYPPHTDFNNPELQEWLRKVVRELLRKEARRILPGRLKEISQIHGLIYSGVRINTAQSRWGSCSSKGNINLSCYLMLLPARLIDYVLLHELCHTREMNHGPRFRAILDACTQGKASALEKELKQYRTEL